MCVKTLLRKDDDGVDRQTQVIGTSRRAKVTAAAHHNVNPHVALMYVKDFTVLCPNYVFLVYLVLMPLDIFYSLALKNHKSDFYFGAGQPQEMQSIYRYLSSKMHLQSKATVIFVVSLKNVREEFDTVGGSSETRRSFLDEEVTSCQAPTSQRGYQLPSSLLAPGFNPVFALTTNPLASSCQSALPPVVS